MEFTIFFSPAAGYEKSGNIPFPDSVALRLYFRPFPLEFPVCADNYAYPAQQDQEPRRNTDAAQEQLLESVLRVYGRADKEHPDENCG